MAHANTTTQDGIQAEEYGQIRQESFRRRVLQSRLAHLEGEVEHLLTDIALLNRLCLIDAADRLEQRLTVVVREALRHREALDAKNSLVEVLAPSLCGMAWAV